MKGLVISGLLFSFAASAGEPARGTLIDEKAVFAEETILTLAERGALLDARFLAQKIRELEAEKKRLLLEADRLRAQLQKKWRKLSRAELSNLKSEIIARRYEAREIALLIRRQMGELQSLTETINPLVNGSRSKSLASEPQAPTDPRPYAGPTSVQVKK